MAPLKKTRLGLALAAATLMAGGASGATNTALTVTDFRGAQLRFDGPVRRIVCLIESGLSGLYMLGAEDRVVGVPAGVYRDSVSVQYAALDERIRKRRLPAPGNWDFVNVEMVVGLRPDLVILWAAQKEAIASLEENGIAVYGVALAKFDDIYREMSDFGTLTGKEDRAKELIAFTRTEVARVADRIAASGSPSVKTYFMWAQGPLETAGRRSTANELLERAGAVNACPLPDEHVVASLENVMTWNPDVILMWFDPGKDPGDILRMDGWRTMAAAKNGRVYELPAAFLCDFWTLKFQHAVKVAARWCQPQAFADVSLDRELRSTLEVLYGARGLRLMP